MIIVTRPRPILHWLAFAFLAGSALGLFVGAHL